MAIKYAVQSGNWSNPATWDGGTLPAAGDDVYADGKTVTVDQDINVGSLHTDAREGGTAGGTFDVSVASGQTRTITCTGPEPNAVAGPSNCITIWSPPADATVITNFSPRGGTSIGAYGIYKDSLCTYQHTGNCYSGAVRNTPGIHVNKGSNNVIYGNAYGATGSSGDGVRGAIAINGASTIAQVYGDVYGGQSFGVSVVLGSACTLVGNVYTNGSQPGAYLYAGAKLTVNGNIYGHSSNSGVAGFGSYDSGNLLILNGDAVAQAGPAINANGSRVRVNGNLIPTDSNYAVVNARLELRGTSFISANGRLGFNNLSAFGISSTGNPAIKVPYYDAENNVIGDEDTLATSTTYGNLYPSASDVRYGVSFGPADQWTGTAHIPAPESVAFGVPVDHTMGTAILTQQAAADAVWNELRSAHTTTGTFGAVSEWAGGSGGGGITAADVWSYATRTLTSASGITSDGNAIDQSKIANLDAAVSSRLATTSYVAPDNTSITAIKEKTNKLQFDASNRIIADAQAISASTSAADTLEANIAKLDVAVSTRLAATAYTAPPSEANIWSYATRTLTAFAFPVTVASNNDKTGYSLTNDYDRAKTALAATEYTSPDNAGISAIKAQTDKLQFDANNRVLSDATATVDVGAIAGAVWDELRSEHTATGTFGAVSEWASGGSGGGITAADVWAYATRTLTSAASITSDGQAIDQSRLANLDAAVSSRAAASDARFNYLDAAVSSRLASAAYTPPDNASILAIRGQTDRLQFNASNRVLADAAIDVNAVADAVWDESRSTHTAPGSYGAVSEWAGGTTAAQVWSYASRTLTSAASITSDGQAIDQAKIANLDVSVSSRAATSDARFSYLDAAVSSRLASAAYVAPDNVGIAVIKSQTDKLQFTATNRVLSDATATVDVGAIADAVWDEPRSQHVVTGTFGAVGEWASANAGTGARTIIVNVNDGAVPLESATVRATKGSESYVAKTNAAGQATFYLDDGTWFFVATLAGYSGASASHVVDAAQSPLTISLSPLNISPSPPGTVTGYAIVLDQYGAIEPGVTCSAQLVYTPSGSGIVGDTAAQTSTSDANGVVQFVGLLPGGIYMFTRGQNSAIVAVPRNATDPWQISNFGGSP